MLSQARVTGRDHTALRRSCQDAVLVGQSGSGAFGVVSDGCGSAPHSEVGAALTVATVGRSLASGLADQLDAERAVRRSLARLLRAFEATVGGAVGAERDDGCGARRDFVHDHLLATAAGFYVTDEEALLFCWGDGLMLADDETWVVDRENHPDYPAYALLRSDVPGGCRTTVAEHHLEIRRLRSARRVAVATDGFEPELLRQAMGRRSPALTRWMRVRAREGYFRDDASVAALEVCR